MTTTKTVQKYLIDFAAKKAKHSATKEKHLTFFELAKKSITPRKTTGSNTASQDVDKIVYGIE